MMDGRRVACHNGRTYHSSMFCIPYLIDDRRGQLVSFTAIPTKQEPVAMNIAGVCKPDLLQAFGMNDITPKVC